MLCSATGEDTYLPRPYHILTLALLGYDVGRIRTRVNQQKRTWKVTLAKKSEMYAAVLAGFEEARMGREVMVSAMF